MLNPLLETKELPAFSEIKPQHIQAALDTTLENNRAKLNLLLKQNKFTWDNLITPLEDLENNLHDVFSPVSHMHSVVNTGELRTEYQNCLPKLAEYDTEIGQNEKLYKAFLQISEDPSYKSLTTAQQKVIKDALRDFRLSGVSLNKDEKQEYLSIQKRLSELTTQFENNLQDAQDSWFKHITDENDLAGIPEHAKILAKSAAESKSLDGWVFTLEFPSYFAVISYADSRELREELYFAFSTRASDQGPNANKWDNSKIMEEILELRHQLAKLLGFNNYVELSLEKKMVETPEKALEFLENLVEHSHSQAIDNFAELSEFAKQEYAIAELFAWDLAYYSEKLRVHRYAISQEDLRPYFPEDQVLEGLFNIVKRLYGIEISEIQNFNSWHPTVRLFAIYDEEQNLRAKFYIDLYARPKKRGGAWMDSCHNRHRDQYGNLQLPVAYLVCNFSGPSEGKPATFTHDEVITLFHEFGHGLHHMLTQIEHYSVSGINGVPWDAVELPSQFLENWCWNRESLNLISKHVETGEAIPDDLYEKMLAAKNFQSAMQIVRQLEFALFDLRIHLEYSPETGANIQKILNEVREEVAVTPIPEFNRFQHSFSHIFAGGYAAGYYSYLWAELLSCDAFSKFEETGVFNEETGHEFLVNILEKGGSQEPMELYIDFRGREPTIDALLRHRGLV